MRHMLLLTVVVLQSACGPLIVSEVSEATPGECQEVTDAGSYTGAVTVIRLEDGWAVASASRCTLTGPLDEDAAP